MSTLIGSKALKCSPRCDTLPRRSTTSSLFATPLGSPGRSPAPVSTDPKPTEMSHRGDLPTGSESDVCTFKCSSMWTSVRRNLLPEGLSFLAGTTGAVVAGAMNPLFAYLMILAIPDLYANSRHEIAKQTDKISLKIMGLGVIAVLSNAIQHYHFGRAGEMTSWRLKQKSFEGEGRRCSLNSNGTCYWPRRRAGHIRYFHLHACGNIVGRSAQERSSVVR